MGGPIEVVSLAMREAVIEAGVHHDLQVDRIARGAFPQVIDESDWDSSGRPRGALVSL